MFHDYRGAVHIHSTYSDGKGAFEEIASDAQRAGLDFVITTDHDTLAPLNEGREGWNEGVLVLVGSEVTSTAGHYLALNMPQLPRGERVKDHLEEINKQGGMSFIAHSSGTRYGWDWTNGIFPGFTGMEIYDLTDDLLKELFPTYIKLILVALFNRHETFSPYLDRPTEELRKWDELTLQRKMVGIGGTNVHARFRFFGKTIDPYWKFFKLCQTHMLAREKLSGDLEHDKTILYRALAEGRVYVSFDIWGKACGFRFTGHDDEGELIMGQEVSWRGPIELEVILPENALIRLIRNGEAILDVRKKALTYEVKDRGVYRVEAYRRVGRKDRLWILSNPIYLR